MPHTPPRAVLDTCVLFKLTLLGVLMEMAAADLFEPIWSDRILNELERNWVMHRNVRNGQQAVALIRRLRSRFPEAAVQLPPGAEDGLQTAKSDRHVLAAAIAADASLIVTDNLKDFPGEALTPHGVRAVSPDEFLMEMLQADGDATQAAVELYAAYGAVPPETTLTILGRLATCHAPVFAQSIRERLAGGE